MLELFSPGDFATQWLLPKFPSIQLASPTLPTLLRKSYVGVWAQSNTNDNRQVVKMTVVYTPEDAIHPRS